MGKPRSTTGGESWASAYLANSTCNSGVSTVRGAERGSLRGMHMSSRTVPFSWLVWGNCTLMVVTLERCRSLQDSNDAFDLAQSRGRARAISQVSRVECLMVSYVGAIANVQPTFGSARWGVDMLTSLKCRPRHNWYSSRG